MFSFCTQEMETQSTKWYSLQKESRVEAGATSGARRSVLLKTKMVGGSMMLRMSETVSRGREIRLEGEGGPGDGERRGDRAPAGDSVSCV